MRTKEIIKACQKLIETLGDYEVTWSEVRPAYDGIVFKMGNGSSWKYWYESDTVTKLEPWRSIVR